MAPKLYSTELSPPCRGVLLVANAAKVDLDIVDMNLVAYDHFKPEYLKLNPQHTVPTLDDNGFILADSHAIAAYLVDKYSKNESLYPKDLQKRAVVDQKLHFDSGILFPRLRIITYPIVFDGVTTVAQHKIDDVIEAYKFLEAFLNKSTWLAGETLTIADLCALSTVSSMEGLIPISVVEYPKLTAWFKRCQALPYYDKANRKGNDELLNFIKSQLK